MRRLGIWATGLAAIVPAAMTLLVATLGRAALALHYRGDGVTTVVVAATLLADAVLLLIIRQLILDVLDGRARGAVPRLLPGLLALYGLLFWFVWAPTVTFFGSRLGARWLAEGWVEPESQLIRTALVIAFVLISYQVLVGRYHRSGTPAHIRARLAEWRDTFRRRR